MLILIIFLLCIQILLSVKHIQYSLIFVLLFGFLIPPLYKVPLGSLNLNSFNCSIFIFSIADFFYKNKSTRDSCLKITLLIWFAIMCMMSFIASIDWRPFSVYIKDTILYMLEFFALGIFILKIPFSRKDMCVLSNACLVIGTIVTFYAIFNYVFGLNPYMMLINMETGNFDMTSVYMNESRGVLSRRSSSTFSLPLALGQFMCLLQFYLVFVYREKKYLSLIIYVFFLIPIVLSGSRSCIFPALLLPFMYFLKSSIKVKLYVILTVLVLSPFLYMGLPEKYKDTLIATICVWDEKKSDKVNINGSSVSMRQEQIKSAILIIRDSPLIGKGIGYVKEKGREHKDEMLGYEGFLLQSLIESGLIGTFIFLLLYVKFSLDIVTKVNYKKETMFVIAYPLMYLVSILLTGIVYSTFSYFLLFYVLILKGLKLKLDYNAKHYYFQPIIR